MPKAGKERENEKLIEAVISVCATASRIPNCWKRLVRIL